MNTLNTTYHCDKHLVVGKENSHLQPLTVCIYRAVSIRWTGLRTGLWDWTVGLDSQKSCAHHFGWQKQHRSIQIPLTEYASF